MGGGGMKEWRVEGWKRRDEGWRVEGWERRRDVGESGGMGGTGSSEGQGEE
jgi:hypothetical protein